MSTKSRPDNEMALTHERLIELVTYDPLTGIFRPRIKRLGVRHRNDGALGFVEKNGYRRLTIDYRKYLAGRLAWFFVRKEWPAATVDHKNLDRDDNRISNLRLATHSQNHANTGPVRNSKSGLKGAHWNSAQKCWQSYIKVNGKSIFLGRFKTAVKAHKAYIIAATKMHGDFARFQ